MNKEFITSSYLQTSTSAMLLTAYLIMVEAAAYPS